MFFANDNPRMDKLERKKIRYEFRRQKLEKLINDSYAGNKEAFAKKINKDGSYIRRCLYPEGKKDKKNIDSEIMDAVIDSLELPDNWWSLPLDPEEGEIDLSKFTVEKIAHIKKIEAMEESEFRDAVDIFDAAEEIVRRRNKETDN